MLNRMENAVGDNSELIARAALESGKETRWRLADWAPTSSEIWSNQRSRYLEGDGDQQRSEHRSDHHCENILQLEL